MTNYLVLREKVRAFRADPEVQAALEAAKVPELGVPTLADGETWSELQDWPLPDVDAPRGLGCRRRAPRPARPRAPLRHRGLRSGRG